jgi:radical SAM protein with 4Fe4S-binding SPASM domain
LDRTRIGDLKLHLRAESDGTGVLVVNASAVLFLDKVARSYFDSFMAEVESAAKAGSSALGDPSTAGSMLAPGIVRRVRRKFKVRPEVASADWSRLWGSVLSVATGGSCPFSDFEVRRVDPLSVELSAPYRTDLILTYRCQNNCGHCYAGGPHEYAQMDAPAWKAIIRKLAAWGVPTLVFTGGEPLLRSDLEEILREAQDAGCITGLITNGRLLSEERVASLADAGLDFAQVTLESSEEAVHDRMVCAPGAWRETVAGIKNAAKRIYTTTNTTVTQDNKDTILSTVPFLKSLGVQKFGINALIRSGRGADAAGLEPAELRPLLDKVTKTSANLAFPFIWYTPACYKEVNPVSLGLGVKTCSAASTVLAVEPDGNVMPCQSYYRSLGNAVTDEFPKMWQHPLAIALRNRRRAGTPEHPDFPVLPGKCKDCDELALCGGACPLERRVSCS